MENIIDKLSQIDEDDIKHTWDNWSLEEIKKLLDIYFTVSKKETQIFDLIYSYHGTDGWEEIFRDYDRSHFEDKTTGIEIAINEINEIIKDEKK